MKAPPRRRPDRVAGGILAGFLSLLQRPAFGHTGFTGTSIWIDPANDRFIILLTNRVNPSRARQGIAGVRRAAAEAMVLLDEPR